MSRLLLVIFAFAAILSAVGCSAGEVNDADQKSKKDALQKVSDEAKDPNRQQRPN